MTWLQDTSGKMNLCSCSFIHIRIKEWTWNHSHHWIMNAGEENWLTIYIGNQLIKKSQARREASYFVITLLNGVKGKNIIINEHTKSWTNVGCVCQLQLHTFVAIFIYSLSDDKFISSLEFQFLITLMIRLFCFFFF